MMAVDVEKIIPFHAPYWASGGHSQTIFGSLWSFRPIQQKHEVRIVNLPDGDQLVTKIYRSHNNENKHQSQLQAVESDAVIVLFHGLTGSSDSSYIQRLGGELLKQGYNLVLVNHRNCGDGMGKARAPYHSGRGDDVGAVIAHMREVFSGKKIVVFGVSMSANAILYLLSKRQDLSQPDFAVVVNPPINLSRATQLIQKGFNRFYEKKFVVLISRLVRELQKKGLVENHFRVHSGMKLIELDDHYTGPAGGFGSAKNYYEQCSTFQSLGLVQTSTVILMSQDDPFIGSDDFVRAHLSSCITLHLVKSGGHVGYIHREPTPLGTHCWMDYAVTEYLKQYLGFCKEPVQEASAQVGALSSSNERGG